MNVIKKAQIKTPTQWHAKYTGYDKTAVINIIMWLNDSNAKAASERTKTALSKASGVSPSLVTQILGGIYPAPPEKFIAQMEDSIRHWYADPEQPDTLVPTSVFLLVNLACRKAREFRSFSVIAGAVGVGKTCSLKEYVRKNPNSIYIRGNSVLNPSSIIDELLSHLGLRENGSNYAKLKAVTDNLRNTNRLIILDEADMVPGKTLETLRSVRDMAEVGVLLSGTQALRAQIGQEFGQFDQIRSRVAFWPEIIKSLTTDDIHAISKKYLSCYELSENETFGNIVDCLKNISKGSARVLIEDIFPNIKASMEKYPEWKLDCGVINNIARQFLGFTA